MSSTERTHKLYCSRKHTWRKTQSLFLSGMKTVRSDNGVGTAIGVKYNIKFDSVQLNVKTINYTAVKVKCMRGVVLIL